MSDQQDDLAFTPAGFRPKHAAKYLDLGEATLRGLPIVPLRIYPGGKGKKPVVIYRRKDLDAWLDGEAERQGAGVIRRAS